MKTREPKILEGVSITEMSSEGKGIAKIDGKVYFVRGAVPEDVVDIRVKKSKSSYAEADIHQLITLFITNSAFMRTFWHLWGL